MALSQFVPPIGITDIDETDAAKIDGITNGTAAANKALVVDANIDIAGIRNVTATGSFIIGSADMNETDLEKLDGITNGTGAANKALVLSAGSTITTGITGLVSSDYLSASRTLLNSGGSTSGAVGQQSIINLTSSIADNTGTPICTFTVPNAAHAAIARLTIYGSLGAGGAVGANEAVGAVSYNLAIARTAGVATVPTMSAAYGSAMTAVAGAATVTVVAAVSAIAGNNDATQTFTVDVTINSSAGSSANHTAMVIVELYNANATGISVT